MTNEPKVLSKEARSNLAAVLNESFDTSLKGYSFIGVVEAYEATVVALEEQLAQKDTALKRLRQAATKVVHVQDDMTPMQTIAALDAALSAAPCTKHYFQDWVLQDVLPVQVRRICARCGVQAKDGTR